MQDLKIILIKFALSTIIAFISVTGISDVTIKKTNSNDTVNYGLKESVLKLDKIESLLNQKTNFNYANSTKRRDSPTQQEFRTGK